MQFAFTEEQEQLRREARSLLESREPSWQELAELGWLGVSVPEERGGAGLGFVEEAVLVEELGRALYPGPYFASVVLALPALPAEAQGAVIRGERTYTLALDGQPAPDRDQVDEEAFVPDETLRGRIRDRAYAALAAEAVGIAQKALELSVEHAKTREQFGRPIGVYQAVAHRVADMYVETELARSLAYWAAWSVAEDEEDGSLAAAAAKAYASEAAVAACERAIQVHGGIGFTWEHPLQRYYKRAQWIESFGGYPATQRAAVAERLLD
jgi:alkylation response protein AidB-like acyl-CoA dehydrogenase